LFLNGVTVADRALLTVRLLDANNQIAAAGDVNGDGKPDLLIQNAASGAVTAWLMDGITRIGVRAIASDASAIPAWHLRVATDVDGDGNTDLIWENQDTGQLAVWLMQGTTVVSPQLLTPNSVPDPAWLLVAPR
jgi:hypothetical protein